MGICISYLRTLTLKICPTAIIAQQSNQTRNLSVFSKSSDVSETSPRFNSFNLEFLPQKQQLPPSTQVSMLPLLLCLMCMGVVCQSHSLEKQELICFTATTECQSDSRKNWDSLQKLSKLRRRYGSWWRWTICYFTQEEFVTGLLKLNCSTLQELKRKLPRLKKDLDNNQTFTEIYEYAFEFSKDDPTQKALRTWSSPFFSVHNQTRNSNATFH
jgi:hypothetical protein